MTALKIQDKVRRHKRQLSVRESAGEREPNWRSVLFARLLFRLFRSRSGFWRFLFLLLLFGVVESLHDNFLFCDHAASLCFPKTKQEKRNRSGKNVEFCFAADLGFRLPTEKLRREEESEREPSHQ